MFYTISFEPWRQTTAKHPIQQQYFFLIVNSHTLIAFSPQVGMVQGLVFFLFGGAGGEGMGRWGQVSLALGFVFFLFEEGVWEFFLSFVLQET